MPKKLCGFRLSEIAFNTFDRIAKDQGITRTEAVEQAAICIMGALYAPKPNWRVVNTQNSTENTPKSPKTVLEEGTTKQ